MRLEPGCHITTNGHQTGDDDGEEGLAKEKAQERGTNTSKKGPNDASGVVWAIGMCFSLFFTF